MSEHFSIACVVSNLLLYGNAPYSDGANGFLNVEVRLQTTDIVGFESRCSQLTKITPWNFDPRALLHVKVHVYLELGAPVRFTATAKILRSARDPVRSVRVFRDTAFIAARRLYV